MLRGVLETILPCPVYLKGHISARTPLAFYITPTGTLVSESGQYPLCAACLLGWFVTRLYLVSPLPRPQLVDPHTVDSHFLDA